VIDRCRRYSYVNMTSMGSVRASDCSEGLSAADGDHTQLFTDTEILHGLGTSEMAYLNRRQVIETLHSVAIVVSVVRYVTKRTRDVKD